MSGLEIAVPAAYQPPGGLEVAANSPLPAQIAKQLLVRQRSFVLQRHMIQLATNRLLREGIKVAQPGTKAVQ